MTGPLHMEKTVQKDLLPPYPNARGLTSARGVSRFKFKKCHVRGAWQAWANDGVRTLNELNGTPHFSKHDPSPSRLAALSQFCNHYRDMGGPPPDLSPAKAFVELCKNSLPYISDHRGPILYDADNLSLPAACVSPIDPLQHMSAEHSERVVGGHRAMLRPEPEALQALADAGLNKAHVDPAFDSPYIHVVLVRSRSIDPL